MIEPEIFLTSQNYDHLIAHLMCVLDRDHPSIDQRYSAVHGALRGFGLDMGDVRLLGDRLVPARYDGLCERLTVLDLECPWTGEPDDDFIRLAIGEAGNIWPEGIREDSEKIAA